jgi:hypothetical protein
MVDPTAADPTAESPIRDDSARPCSRRGALAALGTGMAGVLAGGALGYKFWFKIDALRGLSGQDRAASAARDSLVSDDRGTFQERARHILERHRQQTAESVAALKEKYEKPVFGKVDVWDQIEKLAMCVDTTDSSLGGASQFLHVQQALAAMEQAGIDDDNMFLIALMHDLGKVFLLTDEVPENILCTAGRIGDFAPGIGLDNVIYQFGHGELIYSRIKDHLPDPIAWTARYHNLSIRDAEPFMDARDREYTEKYLKPFRIFDAGFKSQYWTPQVDMARFKDLVHQHFPRPILF